MTLVQKLRDVALTGLVAALVAGATVGCAEPPKKRHKSPPVSPPPVAENIAPIVDSHSVDFLNGYSGVFDVVGQASDPDGYVDRVEVDDGSEIIGIYNTTKSNPFNFKTSSFSIPLGNAEYRIRAFDDKGAVTEVADGFTSAMEAEARAKIDIILQARGYVWDPTFSLGTYSRDQLYGTSNGNIIVDYLITKRDGSRVVIEYLGETDNPQTELNDKLILDAHHVGNLYIRSLPLTETENRSNLFADSNNL